MTPYDAQLLADLKRENRKGSVYFSTPSPTQKIERLIPDVHIFCSTLMKRAPANSRVTTNKLRKFRNSGEAHERFRIRNRIFERDRGICLLCGSDAVALDVALRYVRIMVSSGRWHILDSSLDWIVQFERFQKAIGIRASRFPKSLWDADMIVPKSLGGIENLDNFRTLCLACHRRETNRLIYQKCAADGRFIPPPNRKDS